MGAAIGPDPGADTTDACDEREVRPSLVASDGVYLAPDDAKTDVILAAATAVLGLTLRGFVASLPFYPRPGLVAAILDLGWILALTALVPLLLVRYRQDGISGFGFGQDGPAKGLVVAVPPIVAGIAVQLLSGADPIAALLGRLAAPTMATGGADLAIGFVRVALFTAGTLALYGFLASRAREGFPRSPEMTVTQLVRTLGLGAVGLATVTGLLSALTRASLAGFGLVVVNVLALAGILLLADRLVPAGLQVPRTALITPLIILVVANVFATGGLFRGNLLAGLYGAALGAGAVIAISASAQTKAGVATMIPLVVAIHWFPTCLSPLTLVTGIC